MKTEDDIKRGIRVLEKTLKTPFLPKAQQVTARVSIDVLKWVLE